MKEGDEGWVKEDFYLIVNRGKDETAVCETGQLSQRRRWFSLLIRPWWVVDDPQELTQCIVLSGTCKVLELA